MNVPMDGLLPGGKQKWQVEMKPRRGPTERSQDVSVSLGLTYVPLTQCTLCVHVLSFLTSVIFAQSGV